MVEKQLPMRWDTRYSKYTPQLPLTDKNMSQNEKDKNFKKLIWILIIAVSSIILSILFFSFLGKLLAN